MDPSSKSTTTLPAKSISRTVPFPLLLELKAPFVQDTLCPCLNTATGEVRLVLHRRKPRRVEWWREWLLPWSSFLFGGVAAGFDGATIGGAIALAIGIGIQNFPEGLAVSMPLRRQGVSRFKSFWYGQLSAIVEPIAAVLGAWAVLTFQPILPYALAFAAGAMIYVVVEEVIPETQRDKYTDIATMGFIVGFLVMMTLDVALG